MNDEIREILRILKSKSKRYEYCLNANISFNDESYEAHLLLDYITNLQKENDYYFKKNNELSTLNTSLRNARDDYKSRVKKAVEYINKNKKVVSKYEAKDTRLPLGTFMWGVDNLLNILQNGDNNEVNK